MEEGIFFDLRMIGGYGKMNKSPNFYKEQEYAITFVLKRNFQIFAAPSKNSVYPHICGYYY
jgi:hypothetical protein